jgi:hypothetical protein
MSLAGSQKATCFECETRFKTGDYRWTYPESKWKIQHEAKKMYQPPESTSLKLTDLQFIFHVVG